MSNLTTLLLDGPGSGKIFALIDQRHCVELFSIDGESTVRYQNYRFRLGDQEYMVSAVDERNAAAPDVAHKIRQAKHTPFRGPNRDVPLSNKGDRA